MTQLRTYLPEAPDDWQLEIQKKKIRHLYFRVVSGQKTIRVSLPEQADINTLQTAFLSKSSWILKQMKHAEHLPSESVLLKQGSIRYFRGIPHTLSIISKAGRSGAHATSGQCLEIYCKDGSNTAAQEKILTDFFRKELQREMSTLAEIWQPRIGVAASEFRVRRMKTRWGSCNIRDRRIWINLALIQFDLRFLSYVLVHELLHLVERYHNQHFYDLMERYIPEWQTLKYQLNRQTGGL